MGDFPRIRRVIRPDNHYFFGNQNDLSRYLFGNDQIKGGAACALRYRHPLLHAMRALNGRQAARETFSAPLPGAGMQARFPDTQRNIAATFPSFFWLPPSDSSKKQHKFCTDTHLSRHFAEYRLMF